MEETNIDESDFKEFEVEEASHSIASVTPITSPYQQSNMVLLCHSDFVFAMTKL